MPPIIVQGSLFRREIPPAISLRKPTLVRCESRDGTIQTTSDPASLCFSNNKWAESPDCALELTQSRVDYLWNAYNIKGTEPFVNQETLFIIWQLNRAQRDFPHEWQDAVVQGLVQSEFPRLAVDAYLNYVRFTDLAKSEEAYRFADNLFGIAINYSEASERFRSALVEVGAIQQVTDYLSKSCEVLDEARTNRRKENLLSHTLVLLYNLVQNSGKNNNELAKILEPYFRYEKSDYICVVAVMCTARMHPTWHEACQLEDAGIVQLLFDYFSSASVNENRRFRGINASEISESLRRLAVTDDDKDLLIRMGILRQIGTLLNSIIDEEERQGIDLLFAISSGQNNRSAVCLAVAENEDDCMQPLLWLLDNSQSDEVKDHAKRFLEFLHKKGSIAKAISRSNSLTGDLLVMATSATNKKPNIFLSFHKNDMAAVKKVERFFIGNDYQVVNSVLRPDGQFNAQEAWSKAVIVAVCYSQMYYLSFQCRQEAESAVSSLKKILSVRVDLEYASEGWLKQFVEKQALTDIDCDDSLTQAGTTGSKLLETLANIPVTPDE